MKKKIIIGAAILVIVGIIGFVNYKKGSQAEIKVQTDKVKRQNITQVVSASGKVKPQTEVKVSANVTAKIIELPVKEGDPVHKGQLLVRLERTQYDTYMNQAKADLASANAFLAKSKAEYDRVKELFAKHLASQAELDIASASYEQAKSASDQAHASNDRAADNLAKCDVYSPMDGTVCGRCRHRIRATGCSGKFTPGKIQSGTGPIWRDDCLCSHRKSFREVTRTTIRKQG